MNPYSTALIDVYEAGVRAAFELQRAAAQSIQYAPAQSLFAASAEVTRDLGAAYASCARWYLDD